MNELNETTIYIISEINKRIDNIELKINEQVDFDKCLENKLEQGLIRLECNIDRASVNIRHIFRKIDGLEEQTDPSIYIDEKINKIYIEIENEFNNINSKVAELEELVNTKISEINSKTNDIDSTISNILADMESINSMLEVINNDILSKNSEILKLIDNVYTYIDSENTKIDKSIQDIDNKINNINDRISNMIIILTQEEYDALSPKDPDVFYLISNFVRQI